MRAPARTAALVVGALLLSACNAQLLAQTDVLDVDSAQNINPTGNVTLSSAWDLKYSLTAAANVPVALPAPPVSV